MKNTRFQVNCAVYLILLNPKGEVLLQMRCNTGFMDGCYGLPSGHVEEGEFPTTALTREIREEIGIAPVDFKLLVTMYRKQTPLKGGRTYVDLFFICKNFKGDVENLEPDKHGHLVWRVIDDLPGNTINYIKYVLTHCLEGQINHIEFLDY